MNQTPAESAAFYRQLAASVDDPDRACNLFVIPPFTSLGAVAAVAGERAGTSIWVGAQNVHWATGGRLHRRDLRRACCSRSASIWSCSGTPSGASSSTRPTPTSTEKVLAVLGRRIARAPRRWRDGRGARLRRRAARPSLRQLKIGLHGVRRREQLRSACRSATSQSGRSAPAARRPVRRTSSRIAAPIRDALGGTLRPSTGEHDPNPLRRQRRSHQRGNIHRAARHRRALRRPRRLDRRGLSSPPTRRASRAAGAAAATPDGAVDQAVSRSFRSAMPTITTS